MYKAHFVSFSRVKFGSLQSGELAPDAERTDSAAKHCYYPTSWRWTALYIEQQQQRNVVCESDQLCGSQLSWHHVFNPTHLLSSFYSPFPFTFPFPLSLANGPGAMHAEETFTL